MERERYPRVSDILSVWCDFSSIDPIVLENAKQRGTDVHSYCTAYAKGLWDLDPEDHLKGYVDSFKTWYDAHVDKLISSEIRLYDDELIFSGRYDMIVQLKGEEGLTLIDLKTSAAFQKDWPVKLAAYVHLLHHNQIYVEKALSIRLKKDGAKPCVKPYGDCELYIPLFRSALNLYDYFIRPKQARVVAEKEVA